MLPKLADFLEREGGAIVAAFVLVILGAGFFLLKIPKAEEIIMLSAGAIIMALKGKTNRIPADAEPKPLKEPPK